MTFFVCISTNIQPFSLSPTENFFLSVTKKKKEGEDEWKLNVFLLLLLFGVYFEEDKKKKVKIRYCCESLIQGKAIFNHPKLLDSINVAHL